MPTEASGGWIAAGRAGALAEGAVRGAEVGGEPIVLTRVGGVVRALGGVCSHAYALLSDGEIYEGRLICPLHGSEFDPETGAALTLPATDPIPVYDVK
ncbi:MAG: Rieske (2Fe-2S) protein, partial [Vulcanimicrobiaceae bacterium]